MARIKGIDPKNAGLFTRLVYGIVKRKIAKLTGKAAVIEPVKILAHHPRVMLAMGQMDSGLEKSKTVDARYKNLAMTRTARMVGCPF